MDHTITFHVHGLLFNHIRYFPFASLLNYFQVGFMTNVIIFTSILSMSHSFKAKYHLALLIVYTCGSSEDMHNAAHIMMILGIATNAWLINFCKMRSKRFGASATPYLGAMFGRKGEIRNAVMAAWRKHERTKFRAQHRFTVVTGVKFDLCNLFSNYGRSIFK